MKRFFVWLLCLVLAIQPVLGADFSDGAMQEAWDTEKEVEEPSKADLGFSDVLPSGTDTAVESFEDAQYADNSEDFLGQTAKAPMASFDEADALVGEEYQKIAVNQKITQRISQKGEVDWYSFDIPKNGYISLNFSHEMIEDSRVVWNSSVYDTQKTELFVLSHAGNSPSLQDAPKLGVTPGTYYIKVEGYIFSDVNYYFTVSYTAAEDWESEWNDTYSQANEIKPNGLINGSIMKNNDVDYYKFTIDKPGYVSLAFEHEFVDDVWSYWYCGLLHSDMNTLQEMKYEGRNASMVTSDKVGLPAGTYYAVVVRNEAHSPARYTLRVNYTAAENWEKEWNNSAATANKIATNTQVNGSISYGNDVDWYAFDIPRKGYISLSFSHDYVESSSEFWHSYLYDPNQTQLVKRQYKGNTMAVSEGPKIGVTPGTYYVKIVDYAVSFADYHFTVNYTPADDWETEPNEEVKTANELVPGKTVHGSIREREDIDYYKLTVSKEDSLSIAFSHEFIDNPNLIYWQLYVYDSAMQQLKDIWYKGNTAAVTTSEKISVSPGIYYIKVIMSTHGQEQYNLTALLDSSPENPVTPLPTTPTPGTPTPTPVVTGAPSVPGALQDEAFVEALRDAMGLDEEDEITKQACAEMERLEVSGLGIKSLAGIEMFVNLTYLDCSGNELTTLDVTKLTKLEFLDCSGNDLTSLDVSGCKKLEYLDVRGNNFPSQAAVKLPGAVEFYFFSDEETNPTPTPEIPPAKITLNKTKSTLYVGSSVKKVTLKVILENLTNKVKFKSSDTGVAKVNSKGVVTAIKKGTATITATVLQYGQTYQATCKITVSKPTVKVSSKATVKVGKSLALKVTTKPNGTVKYASANAKIAKVSKTGVVTGVKKGKTTIAVTCHGVTKKVKITVKK